VAYERCGKLIVATDPSELPRLQALHERGRANGVPGLTLLGPEEIRAREPHARGCQALLVPGAGIIDFGRVAETLAEDVRSRGGQVLTSSSVERLTRQAGAWTLQTPAAEVRARYLIVCAGLHGDRLARRAGAADDVQIIPFRGEYYDLVPERRHLVRHLIYPVPDPSLPFLGVHLTRSIHGTVHAGPNAVLALRREGYGKWDVDLRDVGRLLRYPGFWRMSRRHWRAGLQETLRSWSRRRFVQSLQRLVPEVQPEDVQPAPSGVRAQAVHVSGALVEDFDIAQTAHALCVRNAPSPAATASLRIAQLLADRAAPSLGA
jgi:L-2-hydroxyglutarate oxidase LhgO